MSESLQEFREFRERMNERILARGDLTINRFFALDERAYEDGALGAETKELLGLVASMVLRCDDCIRYHLVRCREEGFSEEELFEAFSVALVVGGSIVIPHLRRAVDFLEELPAGPGNGAEQGAASPGAGAEQGPESPGAGGSTGPAHGGRTDHGADAHRYGGGADHGGRGHGHGGPGSPRGPDRSEKES